MSSPSPSAPKFSLAFVVGVAHCGSTLLGRLLNSHPRVLCVGEMMRTDLAVESDKMCGCGQKLSQCDFWTERLRWIEEASGNDYLRFEPELYRRIGASTGAEITVDLSKTRVWRRTRRWKDPDVATILLVRDSRGILASAARVGKDLEGPLKKHLKWTKRLERFTRKRGDNGLVVHYEDLCERPEVELRRICSFLGIDFDERMLRPADQPHHFIHSSASGYLKGSNEIRLDERWRRELDETSRAQVETTMRKIPLMRDRYLSEISAR